MKSKTGKWFALTTAAGLLAGMALVWAPPADAASRRTIRAQLRHSTELWFQTLRRDKRPVGCGNTAWAIVYGYWKRFKGKRRLLSGINLPYRQNGRYDPLLRPLMEEIARDTKSTYGVYRGKGWGRTMPRNMCRGQRYAQRKGYRTRCYRIRGTEHSKFRQVQRWLQADKPVIILINNPKRAFSSLHYPVIERAEMTQKRVAGKWRDRDVRYYVNYGTGERRWIWVREYGRNRHRHYGSYSMILLDIDPRESASGGTSRDFNLAACQDWCRRNRDCRRCSRLVGCGRGYERMRSFREAGRNWYACRVRRSRSQASADNRQRCQNWCRSHRNCAKCSKLPGCGRGYRRVQTFRGRGRNWYACQRR